MSLITGISSYYKLDGNGNDSTGTYNSTGSSGVTYSNANGKINQGAGFSGSGSYIDVANQNIALNSFSISLWMKFASNAAVTIFDSGWFSASPNSFFMNVNAVTVGKISPGVRQSGTVTQPTSNASVNDGNWHHIVITSDGSNLNIYIDGSLDKSAAWTGSNTTNYSYTWGNIIQHSDTYSGDLDEIGVWTRALSSSEVSALYNGGLGLSYPFPVSENISLTMMNASSRLITCARTYIATRSAAVSIMNSVSRSITLIYFLKIALNPPIITIRQASSPYGLLTALNYTKLTGAGSAIPILNNESSDILKFRIYNNYNLAVNIADAINVTVNVWDGATHTASMAVASYAWLHIQQTGWGEGSSQPGAFTALLGQDTRIGGYNDYMFGYSSAGTAGASDIRAGGLFTGCGFLEGQTYINPSVGSTGMLNNFVISVKYEYII